jgi:hypothetical protein
MSTAMQSAIAGTFIVDLASQTCFPVAELPERAESLLNRRLHTSTPYRWIKGARAVDGSIVSLPVLRVGGVMYTSIEALQWFAERLSAAPGAPVSSRTSARRRKDQERTDRDLDALGV